MLLQIRTKDDLAGLLESGISHSWRISESRLDQITNVEIYNQNGSAKIVGLFDRNNSQVLETGRIAIAFKDASIMPCDLKWVGQNPVKYVSSTDSVSEDDSSLADASSEIAYAKNNESDLQYLVDADLKSLLDQFDDEMRTKLSTVIDNPAEITELAVENQHSPEIADKLYLCSIKVKQNQDASDLGWDEISDGVDEMEWYYDVITSTDLKIVAMRCLLKIILRTMCNDFPDSEYTNGVLYHLENYSSESSLAFVQCCEQAMIENAKASDESAACYSVAQSLMRFYEGEEVEVDGEWIIEVNYDINVIRSLFNLSIDKCDDETDLIYVRGSVMNAFMNRGGEWSLLEKELMAKLPAVN